MNDVQLTGHAIARFQERFAGNLGWAAAAQRPSGPAPRAPSSPRSVPPRLRGQSSPVRPGGDAARDSRRRARNRVPPDLPTSYPHRRSVVRVVTCHLQAHGRGAVSRVTS